MSRRPYSILPDELIEAADAAADAFAHRGFKVEIEKLEIGFPFPPTLICTRRMERALVEVVASYDQTRFRTWVGYGKSCNREIKIYVAVPNSVTLASASVQAIRQHGLGLLRVKDGSVSEELAASDLSLTIALPELKSLPSKVQPLLGAAYDHFAASLWREGFEEACKVLDVEARKYLKKWTKTGRIRFIERTRGGPRVITLTARQIDKLTIGQLARRFSQIQAQNVADTTIGQALDKINRDRVNLTHHKWKKQTEAQLRANVPQHMWIILHAMRELAK